MASRSVQISLEEDLLDRIDEHPDVRKRGRSAFIRRALEVYLMYEKNKNIDLSYARGYGGEADRVAEEMAEMMEAQSWLDE